MIYWTAAQHRALFDNWRDMDDEHLARVISQIGPPRSADAVDRMRLRMGLLRAPTPATTRTKPKAALKVRRDGWPTTLGDDELLHRIAAELKHRRAA